ncbi:MAG: 2-dehydro-3-deoxyphosphogalactonate aldolase [Oceanospirillaceae bacterium]|jgi:2-dehydro-3-deoxyphosphogalactonate aldolase
MQQRQLIAILRGIEPSDAIDIAQVLISSGISKIEVPLTSPDALTSIKLMVEHFVDQAIFGAGTVLNCEQVIAVASTGASMIVSPNINQDVVHQTKALGMLSYPGVLTPSECFDAIDAGADGLKIFPASIIGPAGVAAMAVVLPKTTPIFAVGGASADNFGDWLKAGVQGFGIGSALYKPGYTAAQVQEIAQEMVAAYDAAII